MLDPESPSGGFLDLTYESYLALPALRATANPLTRSKHEPFFIKVHQSIELLWSSVIAELEQLLVELTDARFNAAIGKLERIVALIEASAMNLTTLKTLSPSQFDEFRSALGTASGLQSQQFREIEIISGSGLEHIPPFSLRFFNIESLQQRLNAPSLRYAFFRLLGKCGLRTEHAPERMNLLLKNAPITELPDLIELHHNPALTDVRRLAGALVRYDEALSNLRRSHFELVTLILGDTPGTGGTSGIRYLENTLHRRFFPELGALRVLLLPAA